LASQGAFPEKTAFTHQGNGGFFAGFRDYREPYLTFLNIENGVSSISLCENPLLPYKGEALPAMSECGEKTLGSKPWLDLSPEECI
jgi:hypothetical protein